MNEHTRKAANTLNSVAGDYRNIANSASHAIGDINNTLRNVEIDQRIREVLEEELKFFEALYESLQMPLSAQQYRY